MWAAQSCTRQDILMQCVLLAVESTIISCGFMLKKWWSHQQSLIFKQL